MTRIPPDTLVVVRIILPEAYPVGMRGIPPDRITCPICQRTASTHLWVRDDYGIEAELFGEAVRGDGDRRALACPQDDCDMHLRAELLTDAMRDVFWPEVLN